VRSAALGGGHIIGYGSDDGAAFRVAKGLTLSAGFRRFCSAIISGAGSSRRADWPADALGGKPAASVAPAPAGK
jgi:hypothetical protein